MARGEGNEGKGNTKQSLGQQAPTKLNANDDREASKSDEVTRLKSLGQQAATKLNASSDREASKSDEVTNLANLIEKGNEGKGSTKQSLGQQVPTKVNVNDGREASKSDEVTHLKSLGQQATTKLNASSDREASKSDEVTNLANLIEKGNEGKGNIKQSLGPQAPTKLNASDNREARESDEVTNCKSLRGRGNKRNGNTKQSHGQQATTELNLGDDREANKSDKVANLKSLRGNGNEGKGNTKQSLGQQAPTKVNASDDREASKSDEVTNLKSLNQNLLITITNERKQVHELKNALQMSNEAFEELLVNMNKDKSQWNYCEETMANTIQELKNELTQTRVLSENHETSCNQLAKEKDELENNLKECNDKIKELQSLKNELNQTRMLSESHEKLISQLEREKDQMENKLKKCNDEINELQSVKNELNQTRILSESHEKLCIKLEQEKNELENKLKECNDEIKELQSVKNDLNQTRILSESHAKLCSQLGQDKKELENKVKECNDMIEELQGKMNEDRCLWDASNADMQREIVKLQNKLDSVVNGRKVLNQKHEEMCAKHRNDKNELRKCNEGAKKLKAKMVEDKRLWDSSRVNLEGKIAELQNEIDETRKLSKEQEELCSQLRQEKIEMENNLKKINDGTMKLNAKMTEDKQLWDSCKTKLEGRVAGLQNELNETRLLSQGHEELCTKLRQEKNELENKLKQSNDINKEIQHKIIEDGFLFDACKVELKGRVAELQDELNETRNLCQKHEKLSTELRQENIELGNKLKDSYDETKELKVKLTEDACLWNLSKAELEGTVAGLQNELNETRLKHEESFIQLRDEKKHLEEKLKEFDDEGKELKEKMTEDMCLWDSSKAVLEGTVAGLQNELNQTRLKHEEFCIHLRDEKKRLEEKLKGFDKRNKELNAEMTENASFWSICEANYKEIIAELQNELNESRILAQKNQVSCNEISKQKFELENKLKESINETKELKEKMTEDGCLWEVCKREFEDKVAKLKNEVNEARMLSQKHEKLWCQSRQEKNEFEKKLEGMQNELDKTNFLSQNHKKQCAVLREQKNELQKELKECNDRIEELNAKLGLWDTCKEKLEGKVAGLLYEKRIMSQEHDELYKHLTDEKHMLEYKLKECNDRNNKLHEKMNEDLCLWETCKADFAGTVAGLQNELQTQVGIAAELNAENSKLKNELEELRRSLQETEENNARVTQERGALCEDQVKLKEIAKQREEARRDFFGSHKAFHANLVSHILLDSQSRVSKCLSTGAKNIILPPNALLSGCTYGWCGGIV